MTEVDKSRCWKKNLNHARQGSYDIQQCTSISPKNNHWHTTTHAADLGVFVQYFYRSMYRQIKETLVIYTGTHLKISLQLNTLILSSILCSKPYTQSYYTPRFTCFHNLFLWPLALFLFSNLIPLIQPIFTCLTNLLPVFNHHLISSFTYNNQLGTFNKPLY